MSLLRVTGEVVRFDRRSIPSKREGQPPFNLREARVLIGRADFTDVRLSDEMADPRDGDAVDWAVEFSGTYQNRPQYRARGDWSTVVPTHAPALAGLDA